ncbi:helix-turn-helix transcriptional regulator [Providencia rettgeri]|uniref:Helix-turn-helix transcriptional regulator n=5 Tax=Providencia TaxID=586 RepID=A0AA42FHH2_9GAMM|nr:MULTISPECIES: helix-turn-helix transcriptional regulator [Providencia]MBC8654788.1 helix-turn-helix transcriptional regulator [Providencia vermicola]HCI97036.1 XRE family transcriptional regulator [Providencia sp.]EIU7557857.1 helix-turn-helix transcriptional regulator [Providencia rettgeri]EIU9515421.1 helix-turn-helix transcriptional regulator [Providencia rettgeri]EJD6081665.1 helix-turn-helix transcriptional regulator [Providencia rettgeri]
MSNYYPISKIVGSKITYYRKMNGMTLNQIANIIGVSEQQQSRYEHGINRINLDRLNQYAEIFNISILEFFIFTEIEKEYIKKEFPIKTRGNIYEEI